MRGRRVRDHERTRRGHGKTHTREISKEVSHGEMQRMWTDKASKMARKPGARRLFLTERGSELVGGGWPPSVLQYGEPPSRK